VCRVAGDGSRVEFGLTSYAEVTVVECESPFHRTDSAVILIGTRDRRQSRRPLPQEISTIRCAARHSVSIGMRRLSY